MNQDPRAQEIAYKSQIVEEVAMALQPWLWNDQSFKVSVNALEVLRDNARIKAKVVCKQIAKYIIPFDKFPMGNEKSEQPADMKPKKKGSKRNAR